MKKEREKMRDVCHLPRWARTLFEDIIEENRVLKIQKEGWNTDKKLNVLTIMDKAEAVLGTGARLSLSRKIDDGCSCLILNIGTAYEDTVFNHRMVIDDKRNELCRMSLTAAVVEEMLLKIEDKINESTPGIAGKEEK